ncbi:hypothetical protein [Aquimarina sp. MAR_2010_214]|uniref:hypothetical protein n=1 Tax=Aquimarina sp. MAR_2010_214 TaxID=1250026 RepID=UPI00117847F5|nr:hypothetical protein [Aquimarina sp. MAR_2010_214]
MDSLDKFCKILRNRSEENKKSFDVLFRNQLYGNCFSILRQELDSMIRVIYLLNISNLNQRGSFIQKTLSGEKWSFINHNNKKQNVTDKNMVDLADNLNGWTQSVYKFGCAFIHLSNFHDYLTEDPFKSLPDLEKDAIIHQMKNYHSANLNRGSSLNEIIVHLPFVMEKITSNFECEIKSLEEKRIKST